MENEKLIVSTDKKIKTDFYIWLTVLVLLGIFCFSTIFPFPDINKTLTINLQQGLILCLLGGIPGILVWSKNKMKTLSDVSDIGQRLIRYKKYVRIRQSVFFILAFLTILNFVFTKMENARMLFLVVLFLCMFIVPTRNRLETEASLIDAEPVTEIDPESDVDSDNDSESIPDSEQKTEL